MSDIDSPPVLRDLQSLLRESIGNDVVVINYKTSTFLPKGSNYSSTLLQVEAFVKRMKTSSEEKMEFVAKMISTAEYQQTHLKMDVTFNKEIYIIEKLAQQYRQLEREAEIKEEDSIDVFPKFYGGRLTRSVEAPYVIDQDAVILMENLKSSGYDIMDRFEGLDLEHMKSATTELARFHALGVALKSKKPELFEAAKRPLNASSFDIPNNEFKNIIDHTIKTLRKDSRIDEYGDRVEQCFLNFCTPDVSVCEEEIQPWISIVHGDIWVNNILFHHGETGEIDGVKFVDYQLARICSSLKDLPFFLSSSSSAEVMGSHFDELLGIYYARFIEFLSKTGCDVTPFSKESFNEQLKKDAKAELLHCILALKFVTKEVSEEADECGVKLAVLMSDGNEMFFDRSLKAISKFAEKGWI